MASNRAVKDRTRSDDGVRAGSKGTVRRGHQHVSRMYLDPERPSVEDIIDRDRGRTALVVHLRRHGVIVRVPRACGGGGPEHRRLRRRAAARSVMVTGVTTTLVIAIDGPAGAGKSTVGRALASRLGLDYLDTGAMYRAVTFAALRRGLDPADLDDVANARPRPWTLEVDDDGVTRRRRRRDRRDPQPRGHRRRQRGRRQQPRCAAELRAAAAAMGRRTRRRRRRGSRHRLGRVPRRGAEAVPHGLTAGPRRTPCGRGRRGRRRDRGVDHRTRPERHDSRRQPADRGRSAAIVVDTTVA